MARSRRSNVPRCSSAAIAIPTATRGSSTASPPRPRRRCAWLSSVAITASRCLAWKATRRSQRVIGLTTWSRGLSSTSCAAASDNARWCSAWNLTSGVQPAQCANEPRAALSGSIPVHGRRDRVRRGGHRMGRTFRSARCRRSSRNPATPRNSTRPLGPRRG